MSPTVDDTMVPRPPERAVQWRFEALTSTLAPRPDIVLAPDRDNLVVEWNGNRVAPRAIRGIILDPGPAAYFTANPGLRIRASVRVNGGPWTVLATCMIGQDSHQLWNGKHAYNFVDLVQAANRSVAQTVSMPVGTPIEAVLRRLLSLVPPLADTYIEPSGRVLGEPYNVSPTGNLMSEISNLAIDYGYSGIATTPLGAGVCRLAYDPAGSSPAVDYDTNDSVFVKSEFEDIDWLSSNEEWIVEVTANQNYQRVGRFKLPVTHPAGEAVRGFPTPSYSTASTPGSVADADQTAYALALQQSWRSRRFTSWVTTGHEAGWVTVKRGGVNWLDQSWSIRVADGTMDHEVGRRVTP